MELNNIFANNAIFVLISRLYCRNTIESFLLVVPPLGGVFRSFSDKFNKESKMDNRLGFIGIIVEKREDSAEKVNELLTQYGDIIIARMGIPYKEKDCNVITLVVDTNSDILGALTGQLGNINGVSIKSALSKNK